MILISKTYEETTPESAEIREFSDSGFEWEDVPYTFKELIKELQNYDYAGKFATINPEIIDYSTMTERSESLHYSHLNNPRSKKYWNKAIKYVFGK